MRSTRASNAVERLKQRSGNTNYSMVAMMNGLFYLTENTGTDEPVSVSEPLALDDFVRFVNEYGPQKPKKISKLDVQFEKAVAEKKRGLNYSSSPVHIKII